MSTPQDRRNRIKSAIGDFLRSKSKRRQAIKPVLPLPGNVPQWRKRAKRLIDGSDHITLQGILVLLEENHRRRVIQDFYQQILSEKRGRHDTD